MSVLGNITLALRKCGPYHCNPGHGNLSPARMLLHRLFNLQLKTDKAQEIKKLNQQIQMVQSDMSKHREALEDCLR